MEDYFSYTAGHALHVTDGMRTAFDKDGYIIVRYVANKLIIRTTH